jgi:hypothetical protein
MEIIYRAFSLAKAGNRPAENDDAWAASPENLRFAVADGATESSFSGAWARQLADSFAGGVGSLRQNRDAAVARAAWVSRLGDAWRAKLPRKLSWLAEEKAKEGGHAAFLGLEFHFTPGGRLMWLAGAVGDCVLFGAIDGRLVRAFPLFCPDGYPRRPALISTRPSAGPEWQLASGTAHPGDTFLLASDALARWLSSQLFESREEWAALADAPDARRWARAVEGLRRQGAVQNDDATLLVVQVSGPDGAPV